MHMKNLRDIKAYWPVFLHLCLALCFAQGSFAQNGIYARIGLETKNHLTFVEQGLSLDYFIKANSGMSINMHALKWHGPNLPLPMLHFGYNKGPYFYETGIGLDLISSSVVVHVEFAGNDSVPNFGMKYNDVYKKYYLKIPMRLGRTLHTFQTKGNSRIQYLELKGFVGFELFFSSVQNGNKVISERTLEHEGKTIFASTNIAAQPWRNWQCLPVGGLVLKATNFKGMNLFNVGLHYSHAIDNTEVTKQITQVVDPFGDRYGTGFFATGAGVYFSISKDILPKRSKN